MDVGLARFVSGVRRQGALTQLGDPRGYKPAASWGYVYSKRGESIHFSFKKELKKI